MAIIHHEGLTQGSDEWVAARCGLLTASEVRLILTPTLKVANNDRTRAHVWEIAAQRITRFVEPRYIGDDMLRGLEDEVRARELYSERYAPVDEAGFFTRDDFGPTIGCSPDGLVGRDGLIEIKSRLQKYQVETIVAGSCPDEHLLQCQTELLVTGRDWLDYISYSAGLPMFVCRIYPDERVQEAIIEAARDFEAKVQLAINSFRENVEINGYAPTERSVHLQDGEYK